MSEQHLDFLDHLLVRRLDRVPPEYLRTFLEDQDIDTKDLRTKHSLLDVLMKHYSIMKTDESFNCAFSNFLRDFVLSAGVSEYIIQVRNSKDVLDWIKTWKDNTFLGQKNKFEIHTIRHLKERFIEFEKDENGIFRLSERIKEDSSNKQEIDKIYFPSDIIFLVASSRDKVSQLNGLKEIEYHRTAEFEIIFRKDVKLVEIRGEFRIIKDFVTTAVMDGDNPLSLAASLFIGEEEDLRNSLIRTTRRRVGIETLRKALDGSFLSMASIVSGSRALRIKIDFDADLNGLQSYEEETHPTLKSLIQEVQPNLDKGRISFTYNNKKYSFMVTKTGGLRFFEYVPEEVVTYVLHAIEKVA